MVMALIEAVYDKDESARRILQESLFTIGKRQPILVLSSCEALVNEENGGHRVQISLLTLACAGTCATTSGW